MPTALHKFDSFKVDMKSIKIINETRTPYKDGKLLYISYVDGKNWIITKGRFK